MTVATRVKKKNQKHIIEALLMVLEVQSIISMVGSLVACRCGAGEAAKGSTTRSAGSRIRDSGLGMGFETPK